MNSKKIGICCLAIIIAAIAISSIILLNTSEETQINILSNSSLYNGDNITVQLTTKNETPIDNQSINVTLIDANGERNTLNLITDSEGKASFTLNGVTVGNYTLECIFGGSKGYEKSNTTSPLEIKEKIEKTQPATKSKSSSNGYSDYEKTEFTGQYDADGKPIYRTVTSTSKYGGQTMKPGIYEEYWSENGPISAGQIG